MRGERATYVGGCHRGSVRVLIMAGGESDTDGGGSKAEFAASPTANLHVVVDRGRNDVRDAT